MSSVLLKLKSDMRHLIDRRKLILRKLGDPVLRETSTLVPMEFINTEEFKILTNTMIKVMQENNGQGIAASQLGVNIQIVAVAFTEKDQDNAIKQYGSRGYDKRQMSLFPLQILINPKIRIVDFETTLFEEGCLSVGGKTGLVSRYETIEVEALNERSEHVKFQVSGWIARVIQHEIHHLKGLLIVDYFVNKKSWFK